VVWQRLEEPNRTPYQTLSVIVPVYNERETLLEIVRRIQNVEIADFGLSKEILLIDDASTDGTHDLLPALASVPAVRVIVHARNRGKGAAVRSGLKAATGDVMIVQDADLEYDPRDYARLLRPIMEGRAQVVYGSRFLGEHKAMYFWHQLGNKALTTVANVLYNTTLTDIETCYKVCTQEVVKAINLRQNRWGFDPEYTAQVLKRGYRIYEVPISYNGREFSEGKKISWRDGFRIIWVLLLQRVTK